MDVVKYISAICFLRTLCNPCEHTRALSPLMLALIRVKARFGEYCSLDRRKEESARGLKHGFAELPTKSGRLITVYQYPYLKTPDLPGLAGACDCRQRSLFLPDLKKMLDRFTDLLITIE